MDVNHAQATGSRGGQDCAGPSVAVRDQIRSLQIEHGFEVVVFSGDGRAIDASASLSREAIERCGAIGYGLKNLSRCYAEMGMRTDISLTVERLVVRFEAGALVLLPATDDMWVAGLVPLEDLPSAGTVLAHFADSVAPLLPAGTDTVLYTLPPVLTGSH
jgi:hypothetical protein